MNVLALLSDGPAPMLLPCPLVFPEAGGPFRVQFYISSTMHENGIVTVNGMPDVSEHVLDVMWMMSRYLLSSFARTAFAFLCQ